MSSRPGRKADTKLTENVPVQAVVILDDFEGYFEPLTWTRSKGMVPLLNRPLIDHTLRFLLVRGVHEAFLFCSRHHDVVSSHVRQNWSSSQMDVHVIVSETYNSVGDVMRDLDRQAKIKSDFILIHGDVVGNVNLLALLHEHRERRNRDKGSLMTCVYRKNSVIGAPDPNDICVFANTDDKVLFYCKGLVGKKNVKVPLQMFKENTSVRILNQLKDTHIAICSVSVPMLYTDNADHQDSDDFIRGTLDNEDIMGNSIYVHLIDGYASRVSSPLNYDQVSRDLICRWNYPFVPDKMDRFNFRKNNIFLETSEQLNLSDAIISKNVMVGDGTLLGSGVSISDSVIGRDCRIGDGVILNRAYIWDNVVIEMGCKVIQSILADGVCLKKNTLLSKGCILCDGVTAGPHVALENICIRLPRGGEKAATDMGSDGNGVVHEMMAKCRRWGVKDYGNDECESDAGSMTESDADNMDYGDEADYVQSFYAEVLDNFRRGIMENISSDNLILEVNSMKHAYNIRINEVNTLIMQAILEVPDSVTGVEGDYGNKLIKIARKLLPIVKNYIRDTSSQLDCLRALEEFHLHKPDRFSAHLNVKMIKFLYDEDVVEEDSVLEWFSEPAPLSELIHPETKEEEQQRVRKENLLVKLINWLKEAEEESDSE